MLFNEQCASPFFDSIKVELVLYILIQEFILYEEFITNKYRRTFPDQYGRTFPGMVDFCLLGISGTSFRIREAKRTIDLIGCPG
jgi:hypothetical protein